MCRKTNVHTDLQKSRPAYFHNNCVPCSYKDKKTIVTIISHKYTVLCQMCPQRLSALELIFSFEENISNMFNAPPFNTRVHKSLYYKNISIAQNAFQVELLLRK